MGQIASGLFSAAGQLMSGQGQAAADKYNARVALENATDSQVVAKSNAAMLEEGVKRRVAEARAAAGGSDVDANQGTPLSIMRDVAQQGELQRRLQIYQGQRRARQFTQEAISDRADASAALNASWWQAGTTVLTTADKALQAMNPAAAAAMGG